MGLRECLQEVLQLAVAGDTSAAVKAVRRLATSHGNAVLPAAAVYLVDQAIAHGSPINICAGIDESEPDMALVAKFADARRLGDHDQVVRLLPRLSIITVLTWAAQRIADVQTWNRLQPTFELDTSEETPPPKRRRRPREPLPPSPPRPPGGWIRRFDPAVDWADDQIAN